MHPLMLHGMFQLVLRLQTHNSAEYFLEACSREDRDEWAASIISTVQKLRPPDGQSQSTISKGPKTLQLHNISLK